ncbi:MAG: polysaccharide deacetylase family protein [Pirellulales bacterium]|nr:polysaccharide deacetylase family protein [Pirellulales bacterium]
MLQDSPHLPIWKAMLLAGYYGVSLPCRWWSKARAVGEHRVPIVVLFYHRVADDLATPWTLSNRCFDRQIRWMADRFDLISLSEAQRRIRTGDSARPAVCITFDDGYAENCHKAIPLLIKTGIPCTYFVTLRNVLEQDPFAHDLARGYRFLPNSVEQLRAMAAAGVEIGAHTYSHPDLGLVADEQELYRQIVVAGRELQQWIDRPVRYFAFPFGQYANLSARGFEMAKAAGYLGVCSAYGGYNLPGDDPFHLQRIHADEGMIRLKNRVTVDPRGARVHRFAWAPGASEVKTAMDRV